jgi:hypothetical protein
MFPRHDGYARSAAFNVSTADINTVYTIHAKNPESVDYIVLSNQATAAAAVQEFGFLKYYHDDIFYYPIPTGGALYQKFLAVMDTENPALETTLHETLALACVETMYIVVNDYWWKSNEVIERLKRYADEWTILDHGKATIFTVTTTGLNAFSLSLPCTQQ